MDSKVEIAQSDSTIRPGDSGYLITPTKQLAQNRLLNDWILARLVCNRQYNYFNGLDLYSTIDNMTTRWNGYIQPLSVLDETSSNIFLNYTRNLIIGYLSQVAMNPVEPKIKAINRKSYLANQTFADLMEELNKYSLANENAGSKFLSTALEATVKGTAIVYEGYRKYSVKQKTPIAWDIQKGKVNFTNQERVFFDDCYQELCRLEDVYISNPFEPNIQNQPYIVWKKTTSYYEASQEFGHYADWKYVQPGSYRILAEPTTFYNQELYNELQPNQVQLIRYYNRRENLHIIMCNNVILYSGAFPFLHGKYPFAKYIFEPYGNDFFWGAGAPFKFMGEQDTENSFVNMMVDKTYGSLQPYGLSSDLDDLIEDDQLAPNKIRKVGDINKWKFDSLPGVNAGEANMFQIFMNMIKENSGINTSPNFGQAGNKITARQVLLMQQQQIQKLSYNMQFLEDGERDRTELRIKNIMQFYSIPKIEKITGKGGKEYETLVYRDIVSHDAKLSDGRKGTKIIKLVDEDMLDPNERMKLQDELSVKEVMGEMQGTPTEAVAIPVSMFDNFDLQIQVIKYSSYTKNQALDQGAAMEYVKWRLSMAQLGVPTDMQALTEYVDETYDIDTDKFTPQQNAPQPGQPGDPNQPPQPGQPQPGQPQPGAKQPAQKNPFGRELAPAPTAPQSPAAQANLGALGALK